MASSENELHAALLPGRRGQHKNSLLLDSLQFVGEVCGSNDQIATFEKNLGFLKKKLSGMATAPSGQSDENLVEETFQITAYADDVLNTGRKHSELSCFMKYKLQNKNKEIGKEMHKIIQKWKRHPINRPLPHSLDQETALDLLPLYLKRCLYYFGLFPERDPIPTRRLIVLWVAEGLVQQRNGDQESPESIAEGWVQQRNGDQESPESIAEGLVQQRNGDQESPESIAEGWVQQRNGDQESPESIAKNYLTELIEKKFIEVVEKMPCGRVKTCRMHDDWRKSCVEKGEKANFFYGYGQSTNSKSSSSPFNILRLVDHRDADVVSYSYIGRNRRTGSSDLLSYYKYLSTFMSFDYREGDVPGEEIGNFLRKGISRGCFQGMRVLDLEGVIRPKLPGSISQVVHLRYLGLRRTYLEMIPVSAIENLLNLETLDLKHTYISELPNLGKLRQLRHLYLNESYLIRSVSISGVGSLKDLRTLCGLFIDNQDAVSSHWQLSRLTKLGLTFLGQMDTQRKLGARISQLKDLESLRLMSIDESVQPSGVYLLDYLSALEKLSSLYLLGNIYKGTLTGYELPQSLIYLTLSQSKLENNPMQALGKLQNLVILRLLGNTYSKEVMTCSSGSFPKLEVLKIWKQEKLSELRVEEKCFEVLGELEIRCCKNFIAIPDGFKHLKEGCKLKLTDMPNELTVDVEKKQGNNWDKSKHLYPVVINAKGNSSGWKLDPIPCAFKETEVTQV